MDCRTFVLEEFATLPPPLYSLYMHSASLPHCHASPPASRSGVPPTQLLSCEGFNAGLGLWEGTKDNCSAYLDALLAASAACQGQDTPAPAAYYQERGQGWGRHAGGQGVGMSLEICINPGGRVFPASPIPEGSVVAWVSFVFVLVTHLL